MNFLNRRGKVLIVLAVLAAGAALFSARVGAQDDGWRIISADYGYKTQRAEVTRLLIDLITRGGENGKIPVNDTTMGGDPAPGHDKILHVLARNRGSEDREFEFKQHTYLDVHIFDVQPPRRDDWDDRTAHREGRDQDERLVIIRGYYGVQGTTANVTDLLRSRVREGLLTMIVTNSALGGDPAPGADKVLIVVYRYQGRETATAVHEGNTLTIP